MDVTKLTTQEIEQKINLFRERNDTLKGIIKDLSDANAKAILSAQVNEYKASIDTLRKELGKRNKQ